MTLDSLVAEDLVWQFGEESGGERKAKAWPMIPPNIFLYFSHPLGPHYVFLASHGSGCDLNDFSKQLERMRRAGIIVR